MNSTSNLNLKASESQGIKYLHSTNWDPQTSTEELTNYLQVIIPSLRLEKLNSRYPQEYASFKLSVPNSELNKIMKPEIWPSGVLINEFFPSKRLNQYTQQFNDQK
ncbi:unnamed protein product [Psylliodes chrysocephalus]|uniref:Uncharacterized protein n=1 Tax=Psylliodes chrysocephalus TaxID=3402493 RepID=A0A9P0GDQ1_9CUCU|nr:unnamed protein product [Psylliodes chrysocephala]